MIREIHRKNAIQQQDIRVTELQKELLHLWEFIWQEGLGEDARDFLRSSRNEPTPLD